MLHWNNHHARSTVRPRSHFCCEKYVILVEVVQTAPVRLFIYLEYAQEITSLNEPFKSFVYYCALKPLISFNLIMCNIAKEQCYRERCSNMLSSMAVV